MRIGDLAAMAGVSCRTLRYYEERGIFTPAGHTAGGERRYEAEDLAQLRRILELKDGVGLSIEEVKDFVDSERRLAEIRAAYRADEAARQPAVRARLLGEGIEIRTALLDRVEVKVGQLQALREELVAGIGRAETLLAELGQATGTVA
jgi:DNA-binding transcriptional MerR regulator